MAQTVTVCRGAEAGAVPRVSDQAAARLVPDALLRCRCVVEDAMGHWDRWPTAAAPEPACRAAALRWQWMWNHSQMVEQPALPQDAQERSWPRSPVLPAPAPRQNVVVVVVALRSFPALPRRWPARYQPVGRGLLRGRAFAPVP